MASNTKLSREQKQGLKDFKKNMPKNEAFGQHGETTVFVKRVSRDFAQVSASYASPDEMKLRAKVGQWYAKNRHVNGELILMRYDPACESVQDFADQVAYDLD